MAAQTNFITSSVTWGGKETLDYFIKPLFIGKKPWETQGVRVIPNIKSGQKLNYFGSATKVLKAYAKGFNAADGSTYTQRTITTYRMKAEMSSDGLDFYQTVYEYAQRTDDWNNLDGTILKRILTEIFTMAVESDIYREFWLNDDDKETLSSGMRSGTADADYNAFDGMWKTLIANAATSPSATQIKRVAFSNGAVAQVSTVTLSGGSSSNLIITFQGVSYTVAYAQSYTVTAAAFVTAHAAAILLRGAVVTSSGADVIFTAANAGEPFTAPTIASASTITGTVAATTANTSAVALSSGESEDMLNSLWKNADITLRNMNVAEKVFLVTDSVFQEYQDYLETQGTERSHQLLENGHPVPNVLTYRGIPVVNVQWDEHLANDFPHTTGENPAYPHRIIYTHIYNLVLGMDVMNQYTALDEWFNKDEEENRFRMKLVMGVNYVHNKLTAVAY